MRTTGVYKIQSISHPDRCYIGSAVNIHSRWTQHLYVLKKKEHHSSKLQNHYDKYGKDDLVFSVLMECEADKIIRKEQCFMNIYKPWFNISPTAGRNTGYKHTDEYKEANSKKWKGVSKPKEQRQKIAESQMGDNNSFAGKHHTIEKRLKQRDWNFQHPLSEESRNKQRDSLLRTIREKKQEGLKYQLELWQSE